MATKLYFHNASNTLSGTFPTSERAAGTASYTATGANTLRKMDSAIGIAQASLSGASLASSAEQKGFMGYFVSPVLSGSQTIGGASSNFRLNIANAESNLNMDFAENLSASIYVWRPSTGAKIGTIWDGTNSSSPLSGALEPSAASTEKVNHGSLSGGTTAINALDGDIVICEVWSIHTQAMSTSYTGTFYFDGTTENTTTNTTVSNHASFIELDDTLVFKDSIIASSLICSSTGNGSLTTQIRFASVSNSTPSVSANATTSVKLNSNATASPSNSAALTSSALQIYLESNSSSSSVAGSSLNTSIRFNTSGSLQSSASSGLSTGILFSSAINTVSNTVVSLANQIVFQSNVVCQSNISSALTASIRFAANAIASAVATSNMSSAMAALASDITCTTSSFTQLNTSVLLGSSSVAQNIFSSNLSTQNSFISSIVLSSMCSALLDNGIRLSVNNSASSNTTSALHASITLSSFASSQDIINALLYVFTKADFTCYTEVMSRITVECNAKSFETIKASTLNYITLDSKIDQSL